MNSIEQEKLKRFANDLTMSDAVYKLLLDAFLKSKITQDVYILAASRLSVDFLNQAWKELMTYKNDPNLKVVTSVDNIGL